MKNNRRQAQFLLRSITDDVPQLLLEENNLVFRNELKKDILIPCSSVISIKILPINRIYNPSVGLLKDGMKGFMAHRNVGVFSIYFNYFIDLNVVTTTNTYLFESLDLENASQFILKLNETIKIIDDVNLIDLFKTKSISELKEYMDKHYKDWAKKYNLENPRTTIVLSIVTDGFSSKSFNISLPSSIIFNVSCPLWISISIENQQSCFSKRY